MDESADPYQANDPNSPSGVVAQKHIQRVIILPGRGGPLDNSTLKKALIKYGAIATSMYMDEGGSYNATSSAYYFSGYYPTNHAVTLAGWDDNYSRSNFRTAPPGDGAFLIKNSWGTYWGQGGYFWVSYYDGAYAHDNSYAQVSNEATTNYAHKYEYDPLGWVSNWGYATTPTPWFANIFTAVASEPLRAVSFYAVSNDSSYTVQVYTNASSGPVSGALQATTSGTVDLAGYVTVILPTVVPLTSGMKFSVVVQLTTPGYDYPVGIEQAVQGYSSAATASPGQSYMSPDGTYWQDMTTFNRSANVCLKAFTGTTGLPALAVSKTHTGDFNQGQTGATYIVRVSNQLNAGATNGAVTVTEIVPAGLTVTSMTGAGWTCTTNACTRFDSLAGGSSYADIAVTVKVASNAPEQVTNQVMLSGGGSVSASASDVTAILSPPAAPIPAAPLNGAANVMASPILSWSASARAASYDVFVGTTPNPPFAANTTATTYGVLLNFSTLYYWRVAARNDAGSAASATCSFSTMVRGSRPFVYADFDGNGTPDLAWQSEATRQVVVDYYGGAGGAMLITWGWLYPGLSAAGWRVRAIGDFNQDGWPDLVWQDETTRQVTVHYYGGFAGLTDLTWAWLYTGTGGLGWHVVAAADFNGDRIPDLVWQNDTTRQVVVHYYGGPGGATDLGWNWLYPSMGAAGWHIAAAADFNRDGVADLVWQNDATSQVTVHYYGGPGGTTDMGWNWLYPTTGAVGWHIAMAADFNADGVPDLVWQNNSTGQVTVHYYGGPGGATNLGWNWLYSGNMPGWSVLH